MASVLLVDDNNELRSIIERGLKHFGHDVVSAVNGKSALAILPKVKYDVVLTDIVMPDMDGLELIRRIRKLDPDAKIIAMSGGGRGTAEDYLSIARNFGAAATLEKPFPLDKLTETIDAVIGKGK